MPLTDHDYIQTIQLFRSENVGCITFKKAINRFGTVNAAISALSEDGSILGGKKILIQDYTLAEKEYNLGIKSGGIFLHYSSIYFPKLLINIYDCPPFLWVLGNHEIFSDPACAIVGSRKASITGHKITQSLAKNLGLNGYITVSGLARGIDTACHDGSLVTGTVAVLANGISSIYPPENTELAQKIIHHGGAIISEAPPKTTPHSKLFIKRNRLISGLSLGTVIIEATADSGSMKTAEFALEQDREVFAVPGSPMNPLSSGTNYLLRNGANWAENSNDVIQILNGIRDRQDFKKNTTRHKNEYRHTNQDHSHSVKPIIVPAIKPTSNEKQKSTPNDIILSLLSSTPISEDELIRSSNLSSNEIISTLIELELSELVARDHANLIIKL